MGTLLGKVAAAAHVPSETQQLEFKISASENVASIDAVLKMAWEAYDEHIQAEGAAILSVLNACDVDHSGDISVKEFREFIRALGTSNYTDKELGQMFSKLHSNSEDSSDALTQQEIVAFCIFQGLYTAKEGQGSIEKHNDKTKVQIIQEIHSLKMIFMDDFKRIATESDEKKALAEKWDQLIALEPGVHMTMPGIVSIHKEMKEVAFGSVRLQ